MAKSRRGHRVDDPFGGGAKSAKQPADSRKAPVPPRGAAAPAPAPAPAPEDPFLGKVVGRCRLEARIGAGKTSIVYRATHTGLNRPVAVKILQSAVLRFPEVVAKFDEEARAVARLDHENILKIYDVVTEGNVHGIVMELLEGESLLDVVSREERLTPTDAMRVVRQAASGLLAAHRKNIIHRDVKPQNLVLLPDGTVKVVDFGLATAADSELAAVRIGTPHYMAPEVCEAKTAETKSDVYSLGITLYHLLVGQPPFAGQTIKQILASHVEGKPLLPERRVASVPKALGELVREMTKRDPLTRIDMEQVIEALDRIGGSELSARPTVRPRRSGRRRRAATSPAVVVVALVAALALVLVVVLASKGSGTGANGGRATGPGGADPGTQGAGPLPPDDGTPPSTGPMPPAVPPTPPVVVPSEAERKAREEREAQVAAQTLKAESERAFATAEGFARANWQDKAAVVQQYRSIVSRFKGTDAASRAARRAAGIESGDVHPHPDRTFTERDAVAAAAEAWTKAKPDYEAAISLHKYSAALALVPGDVQDSEGKVEAELVFWRGLARDLVDFLQTFKVEVMTLPDERRTIRLPKGSAKVLDATEAGLSVRTEDGDVKLAWHELPVEGLALLSMKAFVGKGSKAWEQFAAYAFAHRRGDNFFAALVAAQSAGDLPKPQQERLDQYAKRAEQRFK